MTARLVIATALRGGAGGIATCAAVAVVQGARSDAGGSSGVVLVEVGAARRRGASLLASSVARRLETDLRAAELDASARGALCWVGVPAGHPQPLAELGAVLRAAGDVAGAAFALLPPELWRAALEDERLRIAGGLICAHLPAQRPLAALAVRELVAAGARARVVARPPGAVASRRALAGLDPGGATGERARRLVGGLLAPRPRDPVAGVLAGAEGRGSRGGGVPAETAGPAATEAS